MTKKKMSFYKMTTVFDENFKILETKIEVDKYYTRPQDEKIIEISKNCFDKCEIASHRVWNKIIDNIIGKT